MNALVPRLATPRALPKMDLSEGIPPASRTLVVVPTLITSAQNVERPGRGAGGALPRQPGRPRRFGLLTDLADAPQETLPEDEALVRLAEQRINELNDEVPGRAAFFLFHRAAALEPGGTASGWATSASAGSWPS